ncbi:MAG: glutamine-hydrolyzing GMP synthase [Chloroflexi bacterium]|nr:glutamine-hydrolyzing GMP synthase [Chloroflexota bacterium]
MPDSIAILDYGSQYSQLIARRVREAHVYCELFPWDTPAEHVLALQPKGYILSGGPNSVYDAGAPTLPHYVLDSGLPILGLCYGMQLLAHTLGGRVAASAQREYGPAQLEITNFKPPISNLESPLSVWMSHADRIEQLPPGFETLARSDNSPIAAMGEAKRRYFGLQFHPEVKHTPHGAGILRNFVVEACGAKPEWTPGSIVAGAVEKIQAQVGSGRAIAGVSGGVDSSVAAALVHRAIGDQLTCVFVDTGLLRQDEPEEVVETFRRTLGARLIAVNAAEEFLDALAGVTDPEFKRKIIGEKFIQVFKREALKLQTSNSQSQISNYQSPITHCGYLVQGTIYPDVVESRGPERRAAAKIKTHHNVGGLPADLGFELVEPLRYLFKDEVREVGLELGLAESLVWRQPFPGPGLAVRCLGEVTWERLERLRAADAILLAELGAANLLRGDTAQAFAVLLPVRSVGVMGDGRTYHETIAIRAVTTDDFMTADFARLPYDVLARVSSRIVNEVQAINRVVYDISSKPPATIEWE